MCWIPPGDMRNLRLVAALTCEDGGKFFVRMVGEGELREKLASVVIKIIYSYRQIPAKRRIIFEQLVYVNF